MARNYAKGGGRYATEVTRKMGTDAEMLFEKIITSHGNKYRNATKKEEKFNHFDYVVSNFFGINSCKIEVKSTKSSKRGRRPDTSILFIELKSIGGYPGWIYGNSDIVAFQIKNKFVLFKRLDLVAYVESEIPNMKMSKNGGIKGTLYERKYRNDLVAIFDMTKVINKVPNMFFSQVNKDIKLTYAQVC